MISGTGSPDRWQRLGALLIQRRTALDPRYHNRTTFAEVTGLNYRVIYDIEEARRANFGRSTLAAIEAAYRLEPGAITRFLAGRELDPQAAFPSPPSPPARQDVPFGGGDKDEGLRPWRQQVLREIYARVGLHLAPGEEPPEPSDLPGGEDLAAIPGRRLFPGPEREHEAGTWDDPTLNVREKINIVAVGRRLVAEANERENRRTGLIAGNYPVSGALRVLIPVTGMAVQASH